MERIFWYFGLLIILSSCMSLKQSPDDFLTENSIEPPPAAEFSEITEDSYPPAVEVSGIIDFTSSEYTYLWNTVPRKGKMIIFASTPRREFREEEIEYCIRDAARQVSLFYAAKVDTKQAVKSNNRDLGYLESIKTGFDKNLAEKEISHIKVLEHYRDAEGSYILAEGPDLSVKPDFSWESPEKGLPGWITEVPVLKGFLVSVGVVQRSLYLTDSIKRADDQSLANLSRQISINVKSKRTDLEVQAGTAYDQTHYEISSTVIKGFYVLGRWSEDHGNTFYTLAVCQQGIKD